LPNGEAFRKSQADFYVGLVEKLMMRSGQPTRHELKAIRRDVATMKSRCRTEGLSFLTKTLPLLGKALDRALVSGRLSVPREFSRERKQNEVRSRPAFMQVYFSRLFCSSGFLLDSASPADVRHVRQVCYAAYKLELEYSSIEEARVIANFLNTELELSQHQVSTRESVLTTRCAEISSCVFDGFDPLDVVPRHGPGSVATGERSEAKYVFRRKYLAIHRVYPYYEYFMVGRGRELLDRLVWYKSLEVHESGTAKVVLVPKDSRGPRLISCEPLEYQWIQQGLSRGLAKHLESKSMLTRGQVNFHSQEVNQELALSSSLDGEYATLDLRDASDRVSLDLVRRIFAKETRLLRCLEACRSTATKLPDGRTIELLKYAPMGSALCFPIMAYAIWVLVVAAVEQSTGLPLRRVASKVFVFGDDIVVPTSWAPLAISALERCGLVANSNKCCTSGRFRESCGYDAFKGELVTPSRLRTKWSRRMSDGACLVSYTALANDLAKKGYNDAARYIRDGLEETYGRLPYGTSRASFPCVSCDSGPEAALRNESFLRTRVNKHLQRTEFQVLRVLNRKTPTELDSWPRLLRDFCLGRVDDPTHEVVLRSSKIKRSWAAVY
jgi:hypothetical protein